MKNVATHLKSFGVLTIISLFSLALGSFLVPLSQAEAQVLWPSVAITASPDTIACGQSTTLSWTSSDATTLIINNGIGYVNPTGSMSVSPTTTTTYSISGSNTSGGAGATTVTVTVTGSCTTPTLTCQDTTATNFGGPLPCTYPTLICRDTTATNFGGPLPCTYPQVCRDTTALNYGGALPCTYPTLVCRDTSALNYGGTLPCTYPTLQICRDTTATNYGGTLPCAYQNYGSNYYPYYGGNNYYPSNIQQPSVSTSNATNLTNYSATLNGIVNGNGIYTTSWFNYGTNTNLGYTTTQNSSYGYGSSSYSNVITGIVPNTIYYFRAVAQNTQGTVYGNILSFNSTTGSIYNYNQPASNRPTVVVFTDQTSVPYNGTSTIRWITTNSASCVASGGSVGWAGPKSIGPASFYTGSLTSSKTYTLTCSNIYGFATDSETITVRGQTLGAVAANPTSLVLITSSIDRNQPIVPTIDNTRPRSGDEINYTVSYQNIGTGAITNLNLRINLPAEVDYISTNVSNPTVSGNNTLVFNLGTLKANGEGTLTIKTRVRENVPAGTGLDFPAILSYTDSSGATQSVNANVSAEVWSEPATTTDTTTPTTGENLLLGANVFGAGFLPTNLFGWLFLIILILALVLLAKYLFNAQPLPFTPKKNTTTTTTQPPAEH
ncbi:MAG: hypothetical protein WCP17_01410 [bacterium]